MNTRFFILLVAILMSVHSIDAKVHDILVLDDGFQLKGQITERVPGESITIMVEEIQGRIKTSYLDPQKSTNSVGGYLIRLNDSGLHAYGFEQNSEISSNDYVYYSIKKPVSLIKKGASVYEYSCNLSNNNTSKSFTVDIQKVVSIETLPRDHSVRGLIDVIETNHDEYQGQIIKNTLGETIIIRANNGTDYEINSDEVKSMRKEALDDNEDIFRQAEFLDQVYTQKDKKPIIGIITEKRFDDTLSDNDWIVLLTKDGNEEEINMNDITRYGFIVNNGYREHTVDYGEVWICGKKGESTIPQKSGSKFQVPERTMRDRSRMITVKYSSLDNHEIIIEHKNEDQFKTPYLIKCDSRAVTNGTYSFTPEELMQNTVPESWHTNLDQPDIERHYKLKNMPAKNQNDRYLLFFMTGPQAIIYIINVTN